MAFPTFAPGDVLNASDMNAVGLWLIKAETTFSAATAVNADNVFPAGYNTFRIFIRLTTSGTSTANVQLRVGGVNATSGYNLQYTEGIASTTNSVQATSQSSWQILIGSGTPGVGFGVFDVHRPNEATQTHLNGIWQRQSGNTNPFLYTYAANHTTATAYDGFSIARSSTDTITGAYAVYGYKL